MGIRQRERGKEREREREREGGAGGRTILGFSDAHFSEHMR